MSFFGKLEQLVTDYSDKVPVEIFALAGSFIEEVIAPIPSPIIMTLAGSIAQAQDKPVAYLILLSVLGAIGKTLGAAILYTAANRAEEFFLSKFGRFFGISHSEIESIGKHISGSYRDILVLTIIRALPIVPSAPISVTCGLLKVRLDLFLTATFLGTIVRDGIYLYIGYTGISALNSLLSGFDSIESLMQGLIALALIVFFGIIYHQKRRGRSIEDFKKLFKK